MILSSPSFSCHIGKPKVCGSRGGRFSLKFSAAGRSGLRPRMPLAPAPMLPMPIGRVSASFCMTSGPVMLSLRLNITGPEVMQKLADTRPIGIGSMGAGASGLRGRNPDGPPENHAHHGPQRDPRTFGFPVWQMKDGEDKLIADRLVEIFRAAPKA